MRVVADAGVAAAVGSLGVRIIADASFARISSR
jgi:hypothetical protein